MGTHTREETSRRGPPSYCTLTVIFDPLNSALTTATASMGEGGFRPAVNGGPVDWTALYAHSYQVGACLGQRRSQPVPLLPSTSNWAQTPITICPTTGGKPHTLSLLLASREVSDLSPCQVANSLGWDCDAGERTWEYDFPWVGA